MPTERTALVEVLNPGALTTVQDLGRPGLAHLGIPRSGAADQRSLRFANKLVGNEDGLACLETTLVGPRLKFRASCRIAITGATVAPSLDGEPVAMNQAISVPAGTTLKLGSATAGLRSYIAFGGGIDCDPVLGSRSSNLRSAIGPAKLAGGDQLRLGPAATRRSVNDDRAPDLRPVELVAKPVLRVIPGPRDDRFTSPALELLGSRQFKVTAHSDRVGVRLEGPLLTSSDRTELRSEGIVPGAIQVPPDGQPIVMLADHPTTGGYPVIAVVSSEDLWIVGQLRPGQQIHFRFQPGRCGSMIGACR